MMAFMADVDRLKARRERAMLHGSEASSARECALSPSRLEDIDRLIDQVFWKKLMKLRMFTKRPVFGSCNPVRYEKIGGWSVPPEALAEFPPEWIEAANAGKFICPDTSDRPPATAFTGPS